MMQCMSHSPEDVRGVWLEKEEMTFFSVMTISMCDGVGGLVCKFLKGSLSVETRVGLFIKGKTSDTLATGDFLVVKH